MDKQTPFEAVEVLEPPARSPTRVYFAKWRGRGVTVPRPPLAEVVYSFLGGFFGILVLGGLSLLSHNPCLMAPFGATCVLLFAVPDSPLAQPRAVIGGHLVASLLTLTLLHVLGGDLWVTCLAVAVAIGAMQLTHTVHPPAGATPLVIMLTAPDWWFLLTPVLTGSLALVLLALVFNNLAHRRHYPLFWW
jgi:CBS-domain-containing membrane protein